MRPSPRFLGTVAAVLFAGVTGGAVLGTVPPMRQLGLAEMFPPPSGPAYPWQSDRGRPPPDQYAIVTPEGRFEIEELSVRGLYRAQQLTWDRAFPEPAYAELDVGYVEVPAAQLAEPLATTPSPEAPDPQPEPALAATGMRVIDVTAELAARRR